MSCISQFRNLTARHARAWNLKANNVIGHARSVAHGEVFVVARGSIGTRQEEPLGSSKEDIMACLTLQSPFASCNNSKSTTVNMELNSLVRWKRRYHLCRNKCTRYHTSFVGLIPPSCLLVQAISLLQVTQRTMETHTPSHTISPRMLQTWETILIQLRY